MFVVSEDTFLRFTSKMFDLKNSANELDWFFLHSR